MRTIKRKQRVHKTRKMRGGAMSFEQLGKLIALRTYFPQGKNKNIINDIVHNYDEARVNLSEMKHNNAYDPIIRRLESKLYNTIMADLPEGKERDTHHNVYLRRIPDYAAHGFLRKPISLEPLPTDEPPFMGGGSYQRGGVSFEIIGKAHIMRTEINRILKTPGKPLDVTRFFTRLVELFNSVVHSGDIDTEWIHKDTTFTNYAKNYNIHNAIEILYDRYRKMKTPNELFDPNSWIPVEAKHGTRVTAAEQAEMDNNRFIEKALNDVDQQMQELVLVEQEPANRPQIQYESRISVSSDFNTVPVIQRPPPMNHTGVLGPEDADEFMQFHVGLMIPETTEGTEYTEEELNRLKFTADIYRWITTDNILHTINTIITSPATMVLASELKHAKQFVKEANNGIIEMIHLLGEMIDSHRVPPSAKHLQEYNVLNTRLTEQYNAIRIRDKEPDAVAAEPAEKKAKKKKTRKIMTESREEKEARLLRERLVLEEAADTADIERRRMPNTREAEMKAKEMAKRIRLEKSEWTNIIQSRKDDKRELGNCETYLSKFSANLKTGLAKGYLKFPILTERFDIGILRQKYEDTYVKDSMSGQVDEMFEHIQNYAELLEDLEDIKREAPTEYIEICEMILESLKILLETEQCERAMNLDNFINETDTKTKIAMLKLLNISVVNVAVTSHIIRNIKSEIEQMVAIAFKAEAEAKSENV